MRWFVLGLLFAAALGRAAVSPGPAAAGACPFSDVQTREIFLDQADLGIVRGGVNRLAVRDPNLALADIETSPDGSQIGPPYVPPTLARAISWIESNWAMADIHTRRGEVGPVLTSSSCAYGMMQVLSGMQPEKSGDPPTPTQLSILKRYWANVLAGLQLLIGKWNYAGSEEGQWPYVGARDPRLIEDWYYAVWAYYGFSPSGSPANPDLPWPRPVYNSPECLNDRAHCNYTTHPYQELVFGLIQYPPIVGRHPDGTPAYLWSPLPAQLPDHDLFVGPRKTANWPPPVLPAPDPGTLDPSTPAVPSLGLRRPGRTLTFARTDSTVLLRPVATVLNRGGGLLTPKIDATTTGPQDDWLSWSTSATVAPEQILVTFNPSAMPPGKYVATFDITSLVARPGKRTFTLTVCIDACPAPSQ